MDHAAQAAGRHAAAKASPCWHRPRLHAGRILALSGTRLGRAAWQHGVRNRSIGAYTRGSARGGSYRSQHHCRGLEPAR